MHRKPKKTEDVSTISYSVCAIDRFDSIAVSFDSKNVLNMLYFKDDYYFESSIISNGESPEMPNMLDATDDTGDDIPWRTDPKSIKVNTFKIKHPDMFVMSQGVDAVALTKSRYLVFEKGTGVIHQYSLGTPTIVYLGNFTVQSMFQGFPHNKVDAAFVEFNIGPNNDIIYSLFYRESIWQFKEVHIATNASDDDYRIVLKPVSDKQGVPIQQWHGVSACGIDSVFQYKGVPYFVKGNIFWSAVETEPVIPRDLTYNFLRCWKEEPLLRPNPPTCEATYGPQTAGEIGDGGGNSASSAKISTTAIVVSIAWIIACIKEAI